MLSRAETRVLYFVCRAHAVAECACGKGLKPIELTADLTDNRFHCPGCARDLTEQVEQHYRTCPAIVASGDGRPTILTTGDRCPKCGSPNIIQRVQASGPDEAPLWGCGACNFGFYRYRRAERRHPDASPPIGGGAPVTPAWAFSEPPATYDVAELLDYGGETILAAQQTRARLRGHKVEVGVRATCGGRRSG